MICSLPSRHKGQSAVEYLTTYGWAIVIIAVVLAALYQLGFFSGTNFITTECLAASGFTCQQPVMNVTGYVEVNLGQISNGTMTITGVGCSNSTTQPSMSSVFTLNGSSTASLLSGQQYQIVFQCPGISKQPVGSPFRGYLWVQYNFAGQTGLIQRFATLSAISSTPATFLPPAPLFCIANYNGGSGSQLVRSATPSQGAFGSWSSSTNYPLAVWGLTCASSGGYVYCVGGQNGADINNVYSAPITGTALGPWTAQPNYPRVTDYASCAISGGYLYCVGGDNTANSVYSATISSGVVGSWSSTANYPLSGTIYAQSCAAYSGYLYCVGGYTTGYVANVYSASVSGGVASAWTAQTAYPPSGGYGYGACVVSGGYIYCIGNANAGGGANQKVYSAQLSSGTISSWTATTSYPTAIELQSCAASSGYVYCVGGYNSVAYTSATYSGPLSSGAVSSWTATTSYPSSVSYESCQTK